MARGIANKSLISFNAGELSPKLDARTDIEKYGSGCRILKNAIPEPYGAASRRPGTQYVAPTKVHSTKSALVGFKFSTTTNFVLEFGVTYIRFYSNGARVEVSGTPVEVATPYPESALFDLQVTQINDIVYVTHPNYPVYKLSRISDTSWTFAAVVFDYPALLDENLDETKTVTLSGTTLTANSARFQAGHVGSFWQLAHLRESAFVEQEFIVPADWVTGVAYVIGDIRRANSINWLCIVAHTSGTFNTDEAAGKWTASEADRTSDTIPVRGKWNVRTYGVWSANIRIDRSLDGGTTWSTVRRFSGREDRNIDAEGEQKDESIFRIVLDEIVAPVTPGATTPRIILEVVDAYVYGLVKVTAFTSSTSVTVTVIDPAYSNEATELWSEGAWSDVRGYPRAVTLHEQRLCFGGTTFQPQTVWGSVTDDFENFARGTLDTDSFAYTLGGTQFNAILWFVSQGRLLIGTTAGEWSMWSGDQGVAITPSSVKIDRHSAFGGKPGVPALLVNDVVLFVQKQGLKIRELTYSQEKEGYVAPDLTVLSEHITKGGIVQMAYQAQSDAILWAVTGNGVLIGMTYERGQNVVGWHRHETDGLVESVATIYGTNDDEIWLVVKRTINGNVRRYVERFNPAKWTEKKDCFFVDCGLTYNFAPTVAGLLTGLGHLEGKTLALLVDGCVVANKTVVGGEVTLDTAGQLIQIGLPFETVIKPMRIDTDPQTGNSAGLVKQIRGLTLRLLNTLGLQYGDGKAAFETLEFRETDDFMDTSAPLFTGDKEIQFPGEHETEGDIVIKQVQPLPMTLLAIITKHQVTGK